ncbi:MAG: CRTAC1 family protein [Planctomycetota bacterium]|nr:CRTAC1 family protein [Planctomycetota bacterium]
MHRIVWIGLGVLAACGGDKATQGGASPQPNAEESEGALWFVEEAAARGLDFEHVSGHRPGTFYFPELMGGGVGLFDAEGDGDLDVFLVQSGGLHDGDRRGEHRLFLNQGDGHFLPGAEVSTGGYGMGVACGDVDGDGDVDVYVTQLGANALLVNQGDGTFVDGTRAAGVGDPRWGTSACFFDADADGDLDLYIANYVDWSRETEQRCFDPTGQDDYCSPISYEAPARDTFYRNQGDGTFVDESVAAGLETALGNGLGVVPGDYDGDGDLDLFVANDQTADVLWVNDGRGHFENAGEVRGVARDRQGGVRAGMGADAADVDRDGDLDLIVVHMARESDGFFINQGKYFQERTQAVGIATADWRFTRFGVGFRDLDQDGWLDLFIANGRVNMMMAPIDPTDPYAEPNTLLRGLASGRFELVEPAGGTANALNETSRGAAFGDLDGDGALDVVVVNRDGPAHLLRNVTEDRGHWVLLRVLDGKRDAVGAQITIEAEGLTLRRDVLSAGSYCASSDLRVHVGLGGVTSVTSLRVRFVDGVEETFGPFDADHVITLRRGAGR